MVLSRFGGLSAIRAERRFRFGAIGTVAGWVCVAVRWNPSQAPRENVNLNFKTKMKTRTYLAAAGACVLLVAVGCEAPVNSGRGFTLPEGDEERGKTAFVDLKCYTCHVVQGIDDFPKPGDTVTSPVFIGGTVARAKTYGDLVTAIVHPSHQLTEELQGRWEEQSGLSPMPEFNDNMTVRQMIDLVTFLQPRYTKLEPLMDPYYGF